MRDPSVSNRRTFIKAMGVAALAVGARALPAVAQPPPSAVRFGLDMYSVNQQNWTPFQQLDFAAKWKIKVVHFSDSPLIDANVKVAIENHAGDMQARELKRLVESAGPEYVGVCLDSGNPVWTIEDPHLTLDTLAPYVLTSHMRDSALWNTPEGAAVRWTRMGEGNMGIEDYLRTYIQKCPGRAVSLDVIVSPQPRMFNYRDPKFWDIYRNTPAWEFSRFLALCDSGKPNLEPPTDPAASQAERQLANVEASIRWTQGFLARL